MKKTWLLLLCVALQFWVTLVRANQVTTTLLPVREEGKSEGLLWVQAKPSQTVFLQFDLDGLPAGLEKEHFTRCSLRLVARDVVYRTPGNPDTGGPSVSVDGQVANNDLNAAESTNVVALDTLREKDSDLYKRNTVAVNDPKHSAGLCGRIYSAYATSHGKPKRFSLRLSTQSKLASARFYSKDEGPPSEKPRLVLTYEAAPPGLLASTSWRQFQHDPEHSGRHPWKGSSPPSAYRLSTIKLNGPAVEPPLIFEEKLYLVVRKENDNNYLTALDLAGDELWSQKIASGAPERQPVISPGGWFYVVTATKLEGHDLRRQRKAVELDLKGAKLGSTEMTVGNDGSLFVVLEANNQSFLCGLTPELVPFLVAGPYAALSTPTVSADGSKLFVQMSTSFEKTRPAVGLVVSLANPSDQTQLPLGSRQGSFRAPIVGTKSDMAVFSDSTQLAGDTGTIGSYSLTGTLWEARSRPQGSTSEPVLSANGNVTYLQDEQLHLRRYDHRGASDRTFGSKLSAMSSLVMDGSENVFFLQGGELRAFDKDGVELSLRIEGTGGTLPHGTGVRWMLGADGTLWAHNKGTDKLFALVPLGATAVLEVAQPAGKSPPEQSSYVAKHIQVLRLTLEERAQVILQASGSIVLGPNVKVMAGAGFLLRIRAQ